MRFTKMHGAGNDFIIIEDLAGSLSMEALSRMAKGLCAGHTSLGADGLMVVTAAKEGGDYGMLFFNSDGSLGEMCGNGARCICRYGYERGLAGERQTVETTAGTVTGERVSKRQYRVRLNDPSVTDLHRRAPALGEEYECAYLELGEPGIPHAVVLLPEDVALEQEALRGYGRALRYSPAFHKGANVSFVKLSGEDALDILTYERGVEDFTLACGTGCGAAVSALTLAGLVSGREVRLRAPGGELSVSVTVDGQRVRDIYLTGPTTLVCEGELSEEALEG